MRNSNQHELSDSCWLLFDLNQIFMIKHSLSLVFLLIVGVGCTSNRDKVFNAETIKYGDFATELHLIPEPLTFSEPVMGILNIMHVREFIIFKHHSNSHFYSAYDAETGNFIGDFGRQGRGPNEYTLLNSWKEYISDNDRTDLYLSDMNLKRIVTFDLKQFAQDTARLQKFSTLKNYSDMHMRNHVVNDTLFLAYMYDMQSGDVYLRKYSTSIDEISRLPMLRNPVHNYDEFDRLWGSSLISHDGNKFVMAMLHMDRINIFDLNDPDKSISLMPSEASTPSLSDLVNMDPNRRKIYYEGVDHTDELIFALYHNQLLSEWQKKTKGVELHVFDWLGNPVAKLVVDEYLANFCIDETHKVIYAFDYSENIYRYDISEFLP
jgi:hypothetical protein